MGCGHNLTEFRVFVMATTTASSSSRAGSVAGVGAGTYQNLNLFGSCNAGLDQNVAHFREIDSRSRCSDRE
jgi:hypothetical protein